MSIFSSITSKLKEIFKNMLGAKTIESKLNVSVAISPEMEKAITTWNTLYRNKAPWLHEPDDKDPTRVVSLGLPAMIASEKARTALIEFKSEITTPTEEVEVPNPDYKNPPDTELNRWGQEVPKVVSPTITEDKPKTDTARAEFLNKQYEKLKKQLRKQLEYGIALGGLIIKPYYTEMTNDDGTKVPNIEFDFIRADCFYPLAFDANGNIVEAAFVEPHIDKDTIYRRLEHYKWENNKVEIENKCYKTTRADLNNSNINSDEDLGKEVSLKEVPQWAAFEPKTTINNVSKPLFAYFKMPEANTVDLTSPLGVSGYARAVNLIKDADLQYSRMLWEYEAGEMALNVDRDAFKWIADGNNADTGKSQLPKGQQRLYRQVDVDQGELFEPFAPSLRDTNYRDGLNTILMRIEDVTGLSRGTLSDASVEARTATELKILKQRSYQANLDIQHNLEDALKDAIYAANVLCSLYEITPEGEYDILFEWDDSILVDVNEELAKRLQLMQSGLTSKVEVRQWYFGETERQAKEALQQIADENATDAENDLMNQDQFIPDRGGQNV